MRILIALILIFSLTGCISLKAGYYKETPEERTQKTVGVDTGKMFENQKTKGSIAT